MVVAGSNGPRGERLYINVFSITRDFILSRLFYLPILDLHSLAKITIRIIDGVWDGSSCLHMYCTNRCYSRNCTKRSMVHRICVYIEYFKILKQTPGLETGSYRTIIRGNKYSIT